MSQAESTIVADVIGSAAIVSRKDAFVSFKLLVSCSTIFLLTLAVCVVFAYALGLPYPQIHDEYSYCLAGQTFTLGRLTSPTHPMAEHFEAMHVLQYPSYMAKYPPGQGIALAIGYLSGDPIYGVWISLACATAAMTWTIAAITETHWAFVSSFLFAFSMNCVFFVSQVGYWAQSYWGGAVACLGSALAFGSVLWFGRVFDDAFRPLTGIKLEQLHPHPAMKRNAIGLTTVFVIGLWLLAISRPLEGLLVSIPMSLSMLVLWIRFVKTWPISSTLKSLLVPFLVGATGVTWLAYYNARVTGSPSRFPYLCYEEQYSFTPPFLFQPLRNVQVHNNEVMRSFQDWEVDIFRSQQDWNSFLSMKRGKLIMLWEFFLGRGLSIPALIGLSVSAVCLFRDRGSTRAILGSVGCSAAGLVLLVHSQTVWMNPHYLAPLVPILWCWIALGLRTMATCKLAGIEVGLFFAIASVGFASIERYDEFENGYSWIANSDQWHYRRRQIEKQLKSIDGKHLVLVEYHPLHSPLEEWCYNSADIDRSRIVWARDLGQSKNEALLQYFSDRKHHRLAVGFGHEKLDKIEELDHSGTSK